MHLLAIGLLTYVAFVLRTVLPLAGAWGPWLPRADLALLLLIVCRGSATTGLLTAAVWGLISDAVSRGTLGIDVLSFVLVAYGIKIMACRGWMQVSMANGTIAGAAVVITSVASIFLRSAPDHPPLNPGDLIALVGGPALTTAILVFSLCEGWFWIVGRSRGEAGSSSPEVANRWHMLTDH